MESLQNQLSALSTEKGGTRDEFSGQLGAILQKLDKMDEQQQQQPVAAQHVINQIHVTQNNLFQLFVTAESKYFFEYIDELFWTSNQTDDDDERRKIGLRYFTRIDVNYAPKAVANNLVVEPEDTLLVTWSDGQQEIMALVQLLQHARAENFSLIRVLADGGFGKSTYLWWIARRYCSAYHVYFMEKVGPDAIRNLLENIQTRTIPKPVMILIDDFADKDLLQFIRTLKLYAENSNLPVLIIMAERRSRFQLGVEQKKQQDKIEQLFDDNSWTINYRIASKKSEIFERVYPLLINAADKVRHTNLQKARLVFNDAQLESIAESIYQLILFLQGEGHTNYEFDWVDWDRLIQNEQGRFGQLSELFHLTVSFFQFGINLPLAYVNEFYGTPDFNLKVIHAIGSFADRSPLRLTTEGDTGVVLRNEYVAQWYLSDNQHRITVTNFFEEFLNRLDKPEALKIFLRLSRMVRTYEVKNSFLAGLLNPVNFAARLEKLFIADQSYIDQENVLMEYGLLLLQFDKAKAIATFEAILQGSRNKYALHQLAEWYANDENTYGKAKNYYEEILVIEPDNIHAIVGLYLLANRASRKKIALNFNTQIDSLFTLDAQRIANELSPHSAAELITILILQKEFALAEAVLGFQKKTNAEFGKCHFMLAKMLPFSEYNIPIKEEHFENALERNNDSHTYIIEYAVFKYRLDRFAEANKIMKGAYTKFPDHAERLMHRYNERIFSLEKLYFDKMPPREDIGSYEKFLLVKFDQTRSLISPNSHGPHETETHKASRILEGVLLLRTIAYHSINRLPGLYFRAQARIAACHTQNAKFKGWNNLTSNENYEAAEGIYDSLLAIDNTDFEVNQNLCYNMRAMIDSATDEALVNRKLRKMLRQCNYILAINTNRAISEFYRHRSYAKKGLGDYTGRLADAVGAIDNCTMENYPIKRFFYSDRCIQANNFIIAICDCYKYRHSTRVGRRKFDLNDAVEQYDTLKRWDRNYKFLAETRLRILEIDKWAFKKYNSRSFKRSRYP